MNGAGGIWGWLLQRVAAAGLVVVLGIHLYVLHFAGEHAVLTKAGVSERLGEVGYIIVDVALLGLVLYHALYGLRSVILDYTTRESAVRAWTVGLWVVGLAMFGLGVLALVPFING
ncbi:MAG: hypothetical protein C4551_08065 [Bacillota bacterium]|nr:MAG: hypothetical protein C4551_08065 [Bacillota bacterium]